MKYHFLPVSSWSLTFSLLLLLFIYFIFFYTQICVSNLPQFLVSIIYLYCFSCSTFKKNFQFGFAVGTFMSYISTKKTTFITEKKTFIHFRNVIHHNMVWFWTIFSKFYCCILRQTVCTFEMSISSIFVLCFKFTILIVFINFLKHYIRVLF